MGVAADRFNLRWLYAAAFTAWSLACGFTGFAGTLGVLILLRMFLGIGESIFVPGGMKIVSMFFDTRDRGFASGLVTCGTRFGLAAGAPLIAWLVVSTGWKGSFFVVGFVSLLWLVPWLLVFPARVEGRQSAAPDASASPFTGFNRNLLSISLAHICYGYYWYLLVTWLPDYLVESRHMPLQKAAGYAVIPYLTFTLSEPLGGWIADLMIRAGWNEFRSRKAVITVAFLSSLMLIPAGLMKNDIAAVLMIGGASLVGLSTGNLLALMQRSAPAGRVGFWSSVQNFAANISGIAAPLATGFLIAKTGSYYPGFVVAVVVLLCGLPLYWWGVREPAPERRPA
jgi:MFS transporter, ACS family, D-galactonate transporter